MPFEAPSGDTAPWLAGDLVWFQDLDVDALPDVAWRAAMLEDRSGEVAAAEAATAAGDLELLAVLRDLDSAPAWGSKPDP